MAADDATAAIGPGTWYRVNGPGLMGAEAAPANGRQ
jgi:hypothetical protein